MITLVSHPLCPYVQRAAIVAAEKHIAVERVTIDLARRPDWFRRLSPTGKVPMLLVDGEALFESAAIAEYLDEISPGSLLPAEALGRARHRAWVEFASGTLGEIAGFYAAADADMFEAKRAALQARFARLETAIAGPWFGGCAFGLVDAAFGPVFRYLDAFERLAAIAFAPGLDRVAAWRRSLSMRPSVATAVSADFPTLLERFLSERPSRLASLIARGRAAAA